MDRNEIYRELKMSYEDLQQYLVRKYGAAKYDYFASPECNSKNKKISRTSEGLFCHHMDEDKGYNLASAEFAKTQPYKWQKKERLVYCNILEHFILHMKITILSQKDKFYKPSDIPNFFSSEGFFLLCNEINDLYAQNGTNVEWRKKCFEIIKDNYEDYMMMIKALLLYIDDNYCARKDEAAFLVPGSVVNFGNKNFKILKINKKRNLFLLQLPTGEEKSFYTSIASKQFNYADQIDIVTRKMASGYENFYEHIYEDILGCGKELEIKSYMEALKIDFVGYGYVQYADFKLTNEYGAKNADEYISKALPMYSELTYKLDGKKIAFWRGEEIPTMAMENFFIVRIETMFTVKEGVDPFVRYREYNLLRNPSIYNPNNNYNLKGSGWTVLATSDIYNSQTQKYYSSYRDKNGEIVDAKVILTLGKDDFLLFKETHDIRYLKVLDGCYFY